MTQTAKNEYIADSEGQLRSGATAWRHVRAEFTDVVSNILDTLAPEGPYAYTVAPSMPEAGKVLPVQQFGTTFKQIQDAYESLHRVVGVRDMLSVAEIRTDWYTFMYGQAESIIRDSGVTNRGATCVMFPTLGQEGITGELYWSPYGVTPGAGRPHANIDAELQTLAHHEAFIGLLRAGDVDALMAVMHPEAQAGIRDYVNDTRTVTNSHDLDSVREYLTGFYARYHVRDIELVQRYVSDWFGFAELRWHLDDTKTGTAVEFNTIEITDIDEQGRVRMRIGHGTDPKQL